MVATSSCPAVEALQGLLSGTLPDSEAESIEDHLDHCDACAKRMESLPIENDLVREIQTEAGDWIDANSPILRELMDQLESLQPRTRSDSVDITLDPAQQAVEQVEKLLARLPAPIREDEIGRIAGYRILRLLGVGGMGAVFLAEDEQLQRQLALKVMLPSLAEQPPSKQRFVREARAAAALKNDHVVTIYQVGEDHELPFLAMELLEGQSLHDWLEANPKPDFLTVVRIGQQIAQGLAAAHARGLIHRDVKPANVWLERREDPDENECHSFPFRVKILDFGLARPLSQDSELTSPGAIVGTPSYMAPEQAYGETVDARSDLFSLGCVLYRLCTGAPPYQGRTTLETLSLLLSTDPRPARQSNDNLPDNLEKLIMQLLFRAPTQRPRSALEIIERLTGIEEQLAQLQKQYQYGPTIPGYADHPKTEVMAERKTPTTPTREQSRRHPVMILTVLLVVLGLGLLLSQIIILVRDRDGKVVAKVKVPKGGSAQFREEGSHTTTSPKPIVPVPAITNSIGMKLVLIPPGSFQMGSPLTEKGRGENEGPQHRVEISRPFYVGTREVTQGEYEKVTGKNPSAFASGGQFQEKVKGSKTDRFPVESISWADAITFCRLLSDRPEEKAAGRTYRLPTEAEWEYACRAGSRTPFHQGKSLSSKQANINGKSSKEVNAYHPLARPTQVGSYPANAFGLYDVHGNVAELCADWYAEDYYRNSPRQDPTGPITGRQLVLRGGDYSTTSDVCRSASRRGTSSTTKGIHGFRVVCKTYKVPPHALSDDPRQRVAQWAQSVGGKMIAIADGKEQVIESPQDYQFTDENLALTFDNSTLMDKDLEKIKDLKRLRFLRIRRSPLFTGSGLAHLKGMEIREIYWGSASEKHLQHLRGLKGLQVVYLTRLDSGDTVVQTLSGLSLQGFHLVDSGITDDDLQGLTSFQTLPFLSMSGCHKVTDAGVRHVAKMGGLKYLDLTGCNITDDALKQLSERKNLAVLRLSGDGITDAGLTHLSGLSRLSELYLKCPRISKSGVTKLKEALPKTRILVQ